MLIVVYSSRFINIWYMKNQLSNFILYEIDQVSSIACIVLSGTKYQCIFLHINVFQFSLSFPIVCQQIISF